MKIKDFAKLPIFFIKKTMPSLDSIKLDSIKFINNNSLLQFTVLSSNRDIKYNSYIYLDSQTNFLLDNNCKFRCTCESFKYEYEAMLEKNDALIGEGTHTKLPKKQKLFVCKHLYMCIRFIFKFRNIKNLSNIFKIQIEEEKKGE